MDEKKRIQKLIQKLSNEDASVRWTAAKSLGNIGDVSAVPALINALKDDDTAVRVWTIDALGKIGNAAAVPALIETLKSESDELRWMAVEALRMIGDTSAIPALIEALNDEDGDVNFKAFDAMLKFFRDCISTENLLDFENRLAEGLVRLKDNCQDNGKRKRAEYQVMEMKRKAADKRNELASMKDVMLTDKPKPPKKINMFKGLQRRVKNG